MDSKKILEEVVNEYNQQKELMKECFGDKIDEFEEEDWSETELMAYDLGFAKALMIMIDILKENGVE